ncbi:sodium/hydrogen exchanger [Sulfurifustis variabilis]|uniref:Sodium/hydrogen exchanger n=1 Tax=Sulfurifustis variabilis TaxID=1675686 RepID=A0A1C7AFQ0_9GAMM|nr:cation:proton antiporter family protein [Sulfurifustis variabilis]BAU50202.1 sodium/hydrogen exchanger [Sulfurifustis variabilis]
MSPIGNVFYEFAALLLIAVAVGALALRLRQPLIVAFIAVGILVGPAGFGLVTAHDPIALLATLGIALLLFVVGLKLDLHLIRTLGPVALATGLGQVVFTSVIGYAIALLLGLDHVPAIYVAVALTFSSTIIIVKLLSDKREIDSLHGRIAVGFLIVQDIVVVLVMIGLSAFGVAGAAENGPWRDLLRLVLGAVALLFGVALLMRYVLPPLLFRLAQSPELLVLFGIGWAVVLAALGDYVGLSKEVGAFLAGVTIASTPYREAISTRLVSLRDFLLLFFFIDLGARLDLGFLGEQLAPAIILSLFVLIGNPLIVMVIMGVMGYRKRTSFLAGLTVAQISEFSLILGALGLSLGHIAPETLGLITLVGLVTIGLSTYLILYSHFLYERIAPWLGLFEREVPHREQAEEARGRTPGSVEVILFGLGRFGENIARGLRAAGVRVLGVDFDPEAIRSWQERRLPAQYGDAEDPELHATLPLDEAGWVVCAIPARDVNLALLHGLRAHGYRGRIALTALTEHDAQVLHQRGADIVLRPFLAAAEQTVETLMSYLRPAGHRPPATEEAL